MVRETIVIRLFAESDAADYRSIRLDALRHAPEAFGTTHAEEAARDLTAFEERIKSSWVFGAWRGDSIVGMARLTAEEGQRDRHKASFSSLYVAAEARRRGVASLLVDAALAQATAPIEQVHLTVTTTNAAAIALYQAKGFACYGIEPRALKTAQGYSDEMLMLRRLGDPAASGGDPS